MIRFLKHVKIIWDIILACGDTVLPYSVVDDATAEQLEGLCPKHCATDRDSVVALMRDRLIFPSVADEGLRRALLANITNISCLIPSLWTFFETLKFLEPLCDILRRLIGSKMKGTIRRSLLGCFFPPAQARVQKSERYYIECRARLDHARAADLAYVQLWAFCGRHFAQLSNFTPRKVVGKDRPVVVEQNPLLWQRLATFASDLGFRVPDATRLAEQQSRSKLAVDYLRKANPLSTNFSAAQIERVVLAGFLREDPAEEVLELSAIELVRERRFGRPFEPDLEEDKRHLFVPTVYQEPESPVVNLRFIRHDLFRCIFGSFIFSDRDFGAPILSSLTQESSLLADTETRIDIKRRKIPNSNDDSRIDVQKKRQLDHENEPLNSLVQQLVREIVSLEQANRMLQEEGANLSSCPHLLGNRREVHVDIRVGKQVPEPNAQAEAIQTKSLAPYEKLLEQRLAE